MNTIINKVLKPFHRNEGGAVLLMSLFGILILMLMAWTVYDTAISARDKLQVQASSDVASYSQAAIKARSMNMLAYTNISKRSIWGVHSMYPSYLRSIHNFLRNQINDKCPECIEGGLAKMDTEECSTCSYLLGQRFQWINETCYDHSESICHRGNPMSWGMFRKLSNRHHTEDGLALHEMTNEAYGGAWSIPTTADFPNGLTFSGGDPANVSDTQGHKFGAKPERAVGDKKSLFELYHAEDIRALDNYQRYLVAITPWWGWTEQLVRSMRSGADVSASWPAPAGRMPEFVNAITDGLHTMFDAVSELVGGSSVFSSGMSHNYSLYIDSLPVVPGTSGDMQTYLTGVIDGMLPALVDCLIASIESIGSGDATLNLDECKKQEPFLVEHMLNGLIFYFNSGGFIGGEAEALMNDWEIGPQLLLLHFLSLTGDLTGTLPGVIQTALSVLGLPSQGNFVTHGINYTHNSFVNVFGQEGARIGEPWRIRRFPNEGWWQLHSSNIVMSYSGRMGRFSTDRKKFDILPQKDYVLDSLDDASIERALYQAHFYGGITQALTGRFTYRASGYWSMTRSEIFYAGNSLRNEPDLWHPSWSARLRPISLGDEFEQGQYSMNQVYHDIMPTLALAPLLNIGATSALSDLETALVDLWYMEKTTNAMGSSTIQGVVK